MKFSKEALEENRLAEEEFKNKLKNYATHLRSLVGSELPPPMLYSAKDEPIISEEEAENQLKDLAYNEVNRYHSMYPELNEPEVKLASNQFKKIKKYLK